MLSHSLSHARYGIQLVAIYFKIQQLYAYMYLQRFNTAKEQGFKSMKRREVSLFKKPPFFAQYVHVNGRLVRSSSSTTTPIKAGHCCSSHSIAKNRSAKASSDGWLYLCIEELVHLQYYISQYGKLIRI